jgi:glycosyltransferase involved in cell wall biosynthesis
LPQKRALIVHSVYRHRGGEERMVELETDALKAAGFHVRVLTRGPEEDTGTAAKAKMALGLVAPGPASKELERALQEEDPDFIHFHNILPHWGYASLATALDWGLRKGRKVASTIHNQRWVCANGLFWRDGGHCQKCLDRQNPLWGAAYACRGSVPESTAYAGALTWAWTKNLYNHPAHTLIALNDLTAQRLKRHFPCSSVVILPNPVPLPSKQESALALTPWNGPRLAVAGRLSAEKGIARLISEIRWGTSAAPSANTNPALDPHTQFVIAGDGPLRDMVEAEARTNPRVIYLGQLAEPAIPSLMAACGGVFHGSLVEEQSPTTLRLAAKLGHSIWSWQGRLKPADLKRWGPALDTGPWRDELLKILG